MLNKRYFSYQFFDINPVKMARRQRFVRRVQKRVHHRIDKQRSRKIFKDRLTKINVI
jgi:hypothetical protein